MDIGAVPQRIIEVIDRIEPQGTLDTKLRKIVEHEIRRRLSEYEAINRRFCAEYGMTLEEFESSNMLERLGYSFKAESDYQDWDMAVDGITSLRGELKRLTGDLDEA